MRLSVRVPPPVRQGCTDRTVLRSEGVRRHVVRAVRRSEERVRGGLPFATFLRPVSGPNGRANSVLSDVKKRSGHPAGGDMHGQVFDDWNRFG